MGTSGNAELWAALPGRADKDPPPLIKSESKAAGGAKMGGPLSLGRCLCATCKTLPGSSVETQPSLRHLALIVNMCT